MNTEYKEKLLTKIHTLIKTIWTDYEVTIPKIESWLKNFEGEIHDRDVEQLMALYLLSHFHYIGKREFREILRVFFRELILYPIVSEIRDGNNNTSDLKFITKETKKKLLTVNIIGVGEPSESGNYITYLLRQEADISTRRFKNTGDIFKSSKMNELSDKNIKTFYFVDDLSGSGTTAKKYSDKIISNIKAIDANVECKYFILFATNKAVKKVKKETLFDEVKYLFLLDESFKSFSNTSRYFPAEIGEFKKSDFKDVMLHYGKKINSLHPLGYKNSQLLVGLEYNIPNNTLPIIWKETESWYPIFKRHAKKYSDE